MKTLYNPPPKEATPNVDVGINETLAMLPQMGTFMSKV